MTVKMPPAGGADTAPITPGAVAGFNTAPLDGEPLTGVAPDADIISINVFHPT